MVQNYFVKMKDGESEVTFYQIPRISDDLNAPADGEVLGYTMNKYDLNEDDRYLLRKRFILQQTFLRAIKEYNLR